MNGKHNLCRIMLSAAILLLTAFTAYSQKQVTVSGFVKDGDGEPIIGASVLVSGTTTGTSTGFEGEYTLTVPENAELEFSFIGMETFKTKAGRGGKMDVTLRPDSYFLESVVVVGYGTQKKGSLTGSIAGVGSEELVKTKSENPENLLTGRVAGVRVWQKSSEPGSYNSSIDIRGMGDPLVVIDGIPRSVEDFDRMNPADIDNISVLKDASAAIYGVRGGNGVILITTKKGKSEKTSVNYDGSFTFQVPSQMPGLTDVEGAITLYNEKNKNRVDGSGTDIYPKELVEEYRNGTRTAGDWNNDVLSKWSPQTQHNISVSGGTDKIQYFVSMGYIFQEGFFKSGDLNYNKVNGRANVTAEICRGLKLDVNLAAVADNQNNPYSSSVDIIKVYWSRGILYPAYADKERTMLSYNGLDLDENPVAMMDSDVSGHRKNDKKQFQSSASLEYDFGAVIKPLQGLKIKGLISYDYRNDKNETYRKEYYLYAQNDDGTYNQKLFANSSPSKLTTYAYDRNQLLWNVMLNYNRKFGKHEVGALIGYEAQKRTANNFGATGELLYSSPYYTALTSSNQQVGMDVGTNAFYDVAYQSVISRLNYGYDERYLIEAQFRYDGSSRFAPGHQWGFFPSVSAGWRLSQEPWFLNSGLKFINQWKIRASYGVLGDDSGVNYEWQTGYTYRGGESSDYGWYTCYAPGYVFDGQFVYSADPQPLPNENITWYQSKTFNVGMDFEAWKGLLGITFDYFERNRDGLFAQNSSALPTVVGASAPMENLNSDRNLGMELQLTHRNRVGEFEYNIGLIGSITRYMLGTVVSSGNYGNSYLQWRYDTNNRYSGIQFGYEGDGRFTSWQDVWSYSIDHGNDTLPGDYKYLDWNGDGEISSLDEHPYAFNATPLLNYSLSFGCSWKGIDFSLLLQGSGMGSMIYQEPLYAIWGKNGGGTLEQYMDRWHPTTDDWTDPYDPNLEWEQGYYALTGHSPKEESSFNRVSTAYLRVKQIELGYTFPKIKKQPDLRFRIYFNAYNPFTFTAVKFVDPEHPSDDLGRLYPLSKNYTLGLNFSF